MAERRVPVTLLTGFLGSGKTTLLNAVLSDASSGPIAVIVNEFGDVGLDHDLIAEVSDEVLLMQSGCLCCSIRGDLAQTMTDLLERRTAGELAFERVLIETTGLANAGPILHTLLVNPVLAENTQMDGVVTVADAIHVCATLNALVEAVSQVALADLIVLSKTDLATAKQIAAAQYRQIAHVQMKPVLLGDGPPAAARNDREFARAAAGQGPSERHFQPPQLQTSHAP